MNARQIIRKCILDVLGIFTHPAPSVHILNGHMITRMAGSGSYSDKERFEYLLLQLRQECDLVRFEHAIDMISNRVIPSKPTVAFSFDDGFEDCYTCIAPALESLGINAMFFINPNFAQARDDDNRNYIQRFTVEYTKSPGKRPMSWAQIVDLHKRGFLIGAHTMDHSLVSECSEIELRHQIEDCKSEIEKHIKTTCEYFAWPYGKITDASQEAVNIACATYRYVFSQSDYKKYFSFDGKVINRRHFEPWWPINHVRYFLSCKKL